MTKQTLFSVTPASHDLVAEVRQVFGDLRDFILPTDEADVRGLQQLTAIGVFNSSDHQAVERLGDRIKERANSSLEKSASPNALLNLVKKLEGVLRRLRLQTELASEKN